MSEPQAVTLKNGAEVPSSLVATITLSMENLFKNHPVAFYELVELCKDSTHRLFGNAGEVLKAHSLIQDNGTVHDSIRDIVLASVEGNALDMTMVSPIAA